MQANGISAYFQPAPVAAAAKREFAAPRQAQPLAGRASAPACAAAPRLLCPGVHLSCRFSASPVAHLPHVFFPQAPTARCISSVVCICSISCHISLVPACAKALASFTELLHAPGRCAGGGACRQEGCS